MRATAAAAGVSGRGSDGDVTVLERCCGCPVIVIIPSSVVTRCHHQQQQQQQKLHSGRYYLNASLADGRPYVSKLYCQQWHIRIVSAAA